jgi:hypothetical protein
MMITLFRPCADGSLRYYTLHDRQSMLFTHFAFTAIAAKGESSSRERLYSFDAADAMDAALVAIIRRKFRGGYRVLYAYLRPGSRDAVIKLIHQKSPREEDGTVPLGAAVNF